MLKVIKSKLRVISLVIFLDLSKYNLQGSLPVYSRRSVPNMCKYRLNHRACTFVETLRYAGRGWHCKSTDTIVNTSSAASTTLRSYHLQFCWCYSTHILLPSSLYLWSSSMCPLIYQVSFFRAKFISISWYLMVFYYFLLFSRAWNSDYYQTRSQN